MTGSAIPWPILCAMCDMKHHSKSKLCGGNSGFQLLSKMRIVLWLAGSIGFPVISENGKSTHVINTTEMNWPWTEPNKEVRCSLWRSELSWANLNVWKYPSHRVS